MKSNSRLLLSIILLSITFTASAGNEGGGGDASEARVSEIRADILKWIENDGPKGLSLPPGISLDHYNLEMTNILKAKNVIISFVENDNSEDEELRVNVDGRPKTCRGFYSKVNRKPNILCNISRFENTKDEAQYRLIHHEYAGLVNLERNDGAASDYDISNQLTDYLQNTTVLRLSLKPKHERANLIVKKILIGGVYTSNNSQYLDYIVTDLGNQIALSTKYDEAEIYECTLKSESEKICTYSLGTGEDGRELFNTVRITDSRSFLFTNSQDKKLVFILKP